MHIISHFSTHEYVIQTSEQLVVLTTNIPQVPISKVLPIPVNLKKYDVLKRTPFKPMKGCERLLNPPKNHIWSWKESDIKIEWHFHWVVSEKTVSLKNAK